VDCPKCGFEAAPDASGLAPRSCARCGVVFAKLASRREERRPVRPPLPSPVPAPAPVRSLRAAEPRASSFSLVNVVLLSGLLSASLLYLWHSQREAAEEPPARPPAVAPVIGLTPEPEPEPQPQPETLVEPDAPTEPPHESGPLVFPGSIPLAPPAPAPEDSTRDIPTLPELSEATVSRALVERGIAVSREFPEVASLKQYVAQGFLLLAGREIKGRRFDDALRDVDGAEAWGAPAGQAAAFRALSYGEQQSWELAMKWARTALAYGARDNAAEMHHLIGKGYYYQEQMDKAIEEFKAALAIEDRPEFRASLDRALQEAQASSGFDQKRLSHFIVTYEGTTMESAGRLVLDSMERSYSALVSQLGFAPTEPVVVILYSQRSYHEMGGPHWSAGLFDGKIRIPVQGLETVDEQIRSTLHHELAHAFIHARAGKGVPRWLHEGLAEYLEGSRAAQYGKPLAKLLSDGSSLEMCVSAGQCDVQLFYPAATSLVEYMIDNRGMGGIRDLLTALGEGNDIDQSLRKVMGRDESGLIADWQHFVKRRFG
jgi:tetratricopeptide (TPR) repeat protein